MFRYLSEHPQVCAANRKETYFFAREFDYNRVCTYEQNLQGFENYFSHCEDACKLRLEATPYTMYSQNSAEKIKALLPDAKVLFILRDPVERLYSDYRFHKQREHPAARGIFTEFINEQNKMQIGVPNLLELGYYHRYITPYWEILGTSKVIILLFEEFQKDIRLGLQNLSEELGIEGEFYKSYEFGKHNQTLAVRYNWLNRAYIRMEPVVAEFRAHLMRNSALHRLFESMISKGKQSYQRFNHQATQEKEIIPPEIFTHLVEYYRQQNLALAQALGRPLPWKSYTALQAG